MRTLTGIKSQRCASAVPGADLPENKYLKNGKRYLNHDLELQVVRMKRRVEPRAFGTAQLNTCVVTYVGRRMD